MRAYQVDFFSCVSGRRRWADERRGPGRTKEDRRREQLERKTQGRHVQPVVLAEGISERRRRGHATGTVSDMAAASESGVDGLQAVPSAGGQSCSSEGPETARYRGQWLRNV